MEKLDALIIPYFVIDQKKKTKTRHEARHGKTEAQREYRQPKGFLKWGHKGKDSMLQRFQQHDIHKESQQVIG